MTAPTHHQRVLDHARGCGASLAGLVSVRAVCEAPSAVDQPRLRLPDGARSVLVLGLDHPTAEPELDWWGGPGGTSGNLVLLRLARVLTPWLGEELGVAASILSYHVELGGVFLKDAAVLAGVGVMGINNLVITPNLGPRVRWKAMLLDLEPPEPSGSGAGQGEHVGRAGFDPCGGCSRPCVAACPQGALAGGRYDPGRCSKQMYRDEVASAASGPPGTESQMRYVRYCRDCELACPVGYREVAP